MYRVRHIHQNGPKAWPYNKFDIVVYDNTRNEMTIKEMKITFMVRLQEVGIGSLAAELN